MSRERFIGAWHLRSMERFDGNGKVAHPYGEDPIGFIMYTQDGHMSVNAMRSGRDEFPSKRYDSASAKEQGRTLRSYLAYAGTFTVESETKVVHHVTTALLPNWTGRDQVRYYDFDGDLLTLSTHERGDDSPGRVVIVWERTEANG